jgi:Na+/H+ antiporter NhaD/arsenite permease-like protein
MDSSNIIRHRRLLGAALVCLAATFAGFSLHTLFHVPPGAVALMGASALAIYAGPRRVGVALRQIEWETLLFFFSLFILVGALVGTGLLGKLAALTMHAANGSVGVTSMLILWTSAFASSAVDNIPFVATMIPFIQALGNLGIHDTEPLWWSLALGACLGGNGTLIGASANIVVAGLAEREGEKLSFGRYLKYGFPFMLLSIGISSLYVYFRYIF